MTTDTASGPLRAIGFPISRTSHSYLPGLTTETVVQALATAAGARGEVAEYLHNTITHPVDRGIHGGYLWRMQALLADRILQEYS